MGEPFRPLGTRVAQLAAAQHGVVSRSQLLELELSSATIARWIHAGHLHRIHRGVYAVGHARLVREGKRMAAVLACGEGSALSHEVAGQVLYLVDRNETHPIRVSVPRSHTPKPSGVFVIRPHRLPSRDVTVRLGIPVTTPTRTAWDLAAGRSRKLARRAFERADGHGRLDRQRMRELLAEAPSRRGSTLIRELLASRPLPLDEVRSWLEELLVLVCSENGLPQPAISVPLLGYEVDFLWPGARFIVEADGGDHFDPEQRDSDNRRDFILGRAGHLTRRYSYKAMSREAAVAEEVRSILTERLPRSTPGRAAAGG